MIYNDRLDAAFLLVDKLGEYSKCDGVVVALPRGGVPLGYIVAKKLDLPLDVIPSKKIGHPSNKEYAIGAVCLGESYVIDKSINVPGDYVKKEVGRLRKFNQEKYDKYHERMNPVSIKNKVVIIVDDGIATGYTMFATLSYIKTKQPKEIVVAVPVSSSEAIRKIEKLADKVVCLQTPSDFYAVGQYYYKFDQLNDEDVLLYLNQAEN
jgi:putative phosphoribosyl transferase